MTTFSFAIITELMFMAVVQGIETNGNTTKNTCYENICIPHDYNPKRPPVNSYQCTVYMNIEIHSGNATRSEVGLRSIDVHKMMLTYAPRIIIAWQDPRLKVESNSRWLLLSKFIMDKIWTPRISVRSNNAHTVNHGRTSKRQIQ